MRTEKPHKRPPRGPRAEIWLGQNRRANDHRFSGRRKMDSQQGIRGVLWKTFLNSQGQLHARWLLILLGMLTAGQVSLIWVFHLSGHGEDHDPTYGMAIAGALFVNIFLLTLVFYLVLHRIVQTLMERKLPFSGARLQKKLTTVFILLSLPAIGFHLFSAGLIVHVFERWSNGQLRQMLSSAGEVMQALHQVQDMQLRDFAQVLTFHLPREADRYALELEWMPRELQRGMVSAVFVYDANGRRRHSWLGDEGAEAAWSPPPAQFFQAMGGLVSGGPGLGQPRFLPASEGVLWHEEYQGRRVRRILFPLAVQGPLSSVEVMAVQSPSVASALARLRRNRSDVWLADGRFMLVVGVFVAAIVLLVVLSASWIAVRLARHMVRTIEQLNTHTQRIAKGELASRVPEENLGAMDQDFRLLVQNFNRMAAQLQEQRAQITAGTREIWRSHDQLEKRNRLVELLLETVDAGIVFLRGDGTISAINRKARELLDLPHPSRQGEAATEQGAATEQPALPQMLLELVEFFNRQVLQRPERPFTRNLTLQHHSRHPLFLEVSIFPLEDEDSQPGDLLLLKDVGRLQRTQRALAWREVARRMAHEIKNPLTPIQLSIQRVLRKYKGQNEEDRTVLKQCSSTILQQVNSLKHMVGEFSRFAQLPEASLRLGQLNRVVENAVSLYDNALPPGVELKADLDAGLPVQILDPQQLLRALTNLLDNAIAAVREQKLQQAGPNGGVAAPGQAAEGGRAHGQAGEPSQGAGGGNRGGGVVLVRTRLSENGQFACLQVIDEGCGVPPQVREHLFEPYATTKRKGTGLGLTIVQQIAADHHGTIFHRDHEPHGSIFTLSLPLQPLSASGPAARPPAAEDAPPPALLPPPA